MYWTRERLLQSLPAIYRQRDAEVAAREGLPEGPLSALLGVLAAPIGDVEANIEQVYDNWFVETCEPWVLPYLAALLGVDRLPSATGAVHTPRAYLANLLSYRRRKGTPGMLQQLARDATGWHAHVVEYFQHLAHTQHLHRVRPTEWFCPDLRDLEPFERLEGPFTTTNRLPSLPNIDGPFPSRFNIPNVGLHLWPITAFAPPDATGAPTVPPAPFAIESRPETFPAAEGDPVPRWFLHPRGIAVPLFNRPLGSDPASGSTVAAATNRRSVPDPLRRLPLHRELEALRQAIADGSPRPTLEYFGDIRPVLQLFADTEAAPIPPEEIRIVDFSHGWPLPADTASYQPSNGGPAVALPIRVALDPARGQLAFAPGREPASLRAVFATGFTMALGGGPYDPSPETPSSLEQNPTWQIGVSRLHPPFAGEIVGSLAEAIALWNAQPPGTRGAICVIDSCRYAEDLTGAGRIEIPAGSHLTLIAASWPSVETDPGVFERPVGTVSPGRLMPYLLGSIEIAGTAAFDDDNPGGFTLQGIPMEGTLRVVPGHLGQLNVAHSTLPNLIVEAAPNALNDSLSLDLRKVIVGRIECAPAIDVLSVQDAILGDPTTPASEALIAAETPAVIQRCTVWGPVSVRELQASEVLFLEPVLVARTQTGCVRYSYLAEGSQVPRPFRCQPHQAVADANATGNPSLVHAISLRVIPLFASRDSAHPAYARLAAACPTEIRRGGENRREMGVFASLEEPLRLDFLRASLNDFLRAGLSAGIFQELPQPPVHYGTPVA